MHYDIHPLFVLFHMPLQHLSTWSTCIYALFNHFHCENTPGYECQNTGFFTRFSQIHRLPNLIEASDDLLTNAL